VYFEDAILRARALDDHYKISGKTLGPLHGLPISLKDQFNVQGLDSTIGYSGRAFAPASEDAAVVKILRRLGAVIIAKTNIPQSLMVYRNRNIPKN
jgi:amidase